MKTRLIKFRQKEYTKLNGNINMGISIFSFSSKSSSSASSSWNKCYLCYEKIPDNDFLYAFYLVNDTVQINSTQFPNYTSNINKENINYTTNSLINNQPHCMSNCYFKSPNCASISNFKTYLQSNLCYKNINYNKL